ncbi:capsular exopolysaccharide family [Raineyella antarctica]|uniref:non-specific protein-tyrosine kinase n=1 Tax=Raineyella antarctica TaxID=1577474 RepID=A0A1G6GEF2_9ACTN|nr:polysaccharide biosynthesis tyrosine autokinase [Raineyella antarctica]SDB80381.1 capsular exopolysaccharide family [Raineyella antarctica]
MELRDYIAVLRKYWRSLTALVLLGVIAAATFNLLSTPIYTAKSALFFSVNGSGTASDLAQGTTFTAKQVESYVEVATSPLVLQPVITKLGLSETPADLAKRLTVTVPTNTAVIDIAVTDPSPQAAAAAADAVSGQLVETVRNLSPSAVNGQKSVVATVITPAATPTSPTTPKIAQNLALGLLLGLFLGAGQAILRDSLDTHVRTDADVASVTDAPIIARIALDRTATDAPLLLSDDRTSPRAEAFRRLRTNLQFLDPGHGGRSFVITSSVADEGKTSTAINTAESLADAGLRVLLIDADMRKPTVAGALGLEGSVGLSTVLIGRTHLREVVQQAGFSSLQVLPAGHVPPNPAELLGSAAMEHLITTVTQEYDVVVLDAPPLLPVTDAAILSRITNGALLVVGSGEVRAPELAAAVESLESVEGRILGVVLNKLQAKDMNTGGYYRRYADDVHRQGSLVAPQRAEEVPVPMEGAGPRRSANWGR